MALVDALARIQEIESTITGMNPETKTATANSTTAAAYANAVTAAAEPAPVTQTGTVGQAGLDVVKEAEKYLGTPYVLGGNSDKGIDCSGLVQQVYKSLGYDLPRVVPDQAKMGREVASIADMQPGDLIVSKNQGHILIYAGDNKVIHAPAPGQQVTYATQWRSDEDVYTIRRILPDQAAAAPTAAAPSSADISAAIAAAQQSMLQGSAS